MLFTPHCSDMLCIVLFFRRRIFLRHIFVHHGFYFPKRMGINLQQGVDDRELSFRFGARVRGTGSSGPAVVDPILRTGDRGIPNESRRHPEGF